MAGNSDIYIKISADISDLDRQMKNAEKIMRGAASNMASIASDMTKMITLPLLGLGVAAVENAGKMQQMERAMTSTFANAGRSASDP